MTAGQISDYTEAATLLDRLPASQWLLGDRGYGADWFRGGAPEEKGIRPCIPARRSCGKPVAYDKRKYKRRNGIEIMLGCLKDWQWVAAHYGRCLNVIFWLRSLSPEGMWINPNVHHINDASPSILSAKTATICLISMVVPDLSTVIFNRSASCWSSETN
ncbi:hypothetical protein JK179_03965 [Gluconobacter wancherniae]|nr:hypothetical protein [Gluconobacter wancherniae]